MNYSYKAQKQKETLEHVTHYRDFKNYQEHHNLSKEEFQKALEQDDTKEITLGTYEGDTFKRRTITDEHVLDAIFTELHDADFYSYYEDNDCVDDADISTYIKDDWVKEYASFYNVYTIGNRIYVDRG